MFETVIDRFLRYVKLDTQSQEGSATSPSTEKQKVLGRLLYDELLAMGAADVFFDEENCYVYASVPATDGGKQNSVLGFLAHMDTSPDVSGKDVKPALIENYNGEDLLLNAE